MSSLGGNDELILLAILMLGENAYGATLMKQLTKVTKKEWSIGAVYDPLYRLEKKGFVKSKLTNPVAERGGRSKRLYFVTKAGMCALEKHRQIRDTLSAGFEFSK